MQPGRTVRGVGRHVAVENHQVVFGEQRRQLPDGTGPVQREHHRHRVHGVAEVTVRALEGLGRQIGVHGPAVPRKVEGADRQALLGEACHHCADECSLARAVQAFQRNQFSHEEEGYPPARARRTGGRRGL